jgi:hypothetical protein
MIWIALAALAGFAGGAVFGYINGFKASNLVISEQAQRGAIMLTNGRIFSTGPYSGPIPPDREYEWWPI